MTLLYAIKHNNINLLRYTMREVCVILQAPMVKRPKYTRVILRQLHIFDISSADPILQEVYLANALINPQKLRHTFYEVDLQLKH